MNPSPSSSSRVTLLSTSTLNLLLKEESGQSGLHLGCGTPILDCELWTTCLGALPVDFELCAQYLWKEQTN